MRNAILLVFFAFLTLPAHSQIVNIPDTNFKAALVNHFEPIDSNGDGEIQVSEAANFTSAVQVSWAGITDLTGIEAFTAITGLNCSNNSIVSLDLSNNPLIEWVDCEINPMTSLNVGQLPRLKELYCGGSLLGAGLDVSHNDSLEVLNCESIGATALDVSQNGLLERLFCTQNSMTNLDVSNNPLLEILFVNSNQLSDLDVSNNPALHTLYCSFNDLTALDLSNNTQLDVLECNSNHRMKLLDLSQTPVRILWSTVNDSLEYINLKNGVNVDMLQLNVTGNPALICIQVDDATWSNSNWPPLDPGVTWSENCIVGIEDFQEVELVVGPNPCSDRLTVQFPDEVMGEILVRNALGQVLAVPTVRSGSTISIDTDGLSSGAYHLEVRGEDRVMGRSTVIKR